MRAFIAINFKEIFKKQIYTYANELLANNFFEFRQIKKDNIHLTIHFLGNISNQVDNIVERLDTLLDYEFEFIMELNKWDYFSARKGKLVWVGVKFEEKLFRIASLIRNEFSDINKEKRDFIPHITIARKGKLMDKTIHKKKINLSIPVKKISLMKSEFTNKGVKYKEIFNKQLTRKDI